MKLDGLLWARCADCNREVYIPEENWAYHPERGEVRLCDRCIYSVTEPDNEWLP